MLIIDANCLGCIAKFSLPKLSHEDLPTAVPFGFLTALLRLWDRFGDREMVFCWDSRKSLRKRRHSWYKTRPRKPEEQREWELTYLAFDNLRRDLLPMLGLKNQIRQTGYEADDLLAELARIYRDKAIIVTTDADLYQTLKRSRMYNPKTRKLLDREWLSLKHRVSPLNWMWVKAIAGCSTDTVPGVQGVGIKTAVKWINRGIADKWTKRFHDIYNQWDEVVLRNKWLVELPLEGTKVPEIQPNEMNWQGFLDLCEAFGFESFLAERHRWEEFFGV